jgi:glycosyltransferase involved in cell wall biosynthesis
MKVGLHTRNRPPSLGGGYVLCDDFERTAVSLDGRHQFELVSIPVPTRALAKAKRNIDRLLGRPANRNGPAATLLRKEAARRKLDLLWFNHFEPVHAGIPYVLNIFDLQHRLQPWFPEVSANGEWEAREAAWADGIRRAALVTVGSQEAKEQLCHFYGVPLDNVWVLPFPTPQKAIDFALGAAQIPQKGNVRSKYGIKGDFLYYPAQFWPHKNHANLLHALKLLKERGRDISLVLTGSDHGNQAHVEKVARDLGLAGLVHFCGFVPYEDVLSFYREALALSYVSFFGPENLPPLEAMAVGCPVILSDIPGAHKLHGGAPFLVNPSDPGAIADVIESLLEYPEKIQERVRIGKEFAIKNDSQVYFENFQKMLDSFEPFRRCWT